MHLFLKLIDAPAICTPHRWRTAKAPFFIMLPSSSYGCSSNNGLSCSLIPYALKHFAKYISYLRSVPLLSFIKECLLFDVDLQRILDPFLNLFAQLVKFLESEYQVIGCLSEIILFKSFGLPPTFFAVIILNFLD